MRPLIVRQFYLQTNLYFPTCSHIHSLLLSHFIQEVAKNSLCIAILSQNNALSYAIVPIEQTGITPKNEEKHIARIKPNVALKLIEPDISGYRQKVKHPN